MITIGFILTSLIVILVPGTGVIYTVSTSLISGKQESITAALGCTAGIIPHLLASILGLSAIMHTSSLAFQFIKILGVLYLLYLGWNMLQDKGIFQFKKHSVKKNKSKIILTGILINSNYLPHK